MYESDSIDLKSDGIFWHQRLMAGDPTAPARIVEAALIQISRSLEQRYSASSNQFLIEDAVLEALHEYLAFPSRFDQKKSNLFTYLYTAAHRDFINLSESENRRTPPNLLQISNDEHHELAAPHVNQVHSTVEQEILTTLSPVYDELTFLFKSKTDLTMALMILDNVRETDRFSEVLQIQHLPTAKQRAEVKRHKDRLKKAMRRHFKESDLRNE